MGSLNATGIPVPNKLNVTFRKQDILITQTASADDVETTTTSFRPSLSRTISSGSIVRDDNIALATVDYFEEVSWGTNFGSRSTTARLARDGARNHAVSGVSVIVIESGLLPNTPQEWVHQGGDYITRRDSVTDLQIDKVVNSGVYG